MGETTSNFGLYKPDPEIEEGWGEEVNESMDTIDTEIKQAQDDLTDHEAAADPHADRAYTDTHASDTTNIHGITSVGDLETTTGAAAKVAAHEADTTGVHGVSNTANLETTTGAQTKVDTHAALSDPHTTYQKESEKGNASGYASLDGSGTIPDAQIPAAIARDSEVTSAVSTHAGLSDPHTGYQKESEKGAASGYASLDSGGKVPDTQIASTIARDTEVTSAVSTHAGLSDPHTVYQKESEKGAASGYASLDSGGKVPPAQLPPLNPGGNVFTVASEAAMLALSTAIEGDVAIRTDTDERFILADIPPSTLGNWVLLASGGSGVTSVNGRTGVVTGVQDTSEKGAADGYAPLDGSGLILDSDIPSAIARDSEVTSAVSAHEAAGDPHTGYQLESGKGAADGYAPLDGSGLILDSDIPAAIARDSEVTSAVSTHAGLSDPHTGYQLESEKGAANGYASLDSSGDVPDAQIPPTIARDSEVTSAVSAHEALSDPHPTYQTSAEVDTKVTTHAGLSDPHTGYQLESQKDTASGYAGLDGSGLVPDARIASTIARDSEVTSAVSAHLSGADHTAHPSLASHDSLGLATDAELAAHAATPHGGAGGSGIGAYAAQVYMSGSTVIAITRAGTTITSGTNARTVIQAAIDHVNALTWGGTVSLAAERFDLAATSAGVPLLTLKNKVNLAGEGWTMTIGTGSSPTGGTVLRATGSIDPTYMIEMQDCYGSHVRGMAIDCNNVASNGIHMSGWQQRVHDIGVRAAKAGGNLIYVTGGTDGTAFGYADTHIYDALLTGSGGGACKAIFVDQVTGLASQASDGNIGPNVRSFSCTNGIIDIECGGWVIDGPTHLTGNTNVLFGVKMNQGQISDTYIDSIGSGPAIDISGDGNLVDNVHMELAGNLPVNNPHSAIRLAPGGEGITIGQIWFNSLQTTGSKQLRWLVDTGVSPANRGIDIDSLMVTWTAGAGVNPAPNGFVGSGTPGAGGTDWTSAVLAGYGRPRFAYAKLRN